MLDGIKNAVGSAGNMAKAAQAQQRIKKLLEGIKVVGSTKNGSINVTVNGEQKMIDIQISADLINAIAQDFTLSTDPDKVAKGQQILQDGIIEAANNAMSNVQERMVKEMTQSGELSDIMSILQGGGN
jgi:DNA-binding protein YbaB